MGGQGSGARGERLGARRNRFGGIGKVEGVLLHGLCHVTCSRVRMTSDGVLKVKTIVFRGEKLAEVSED